MQLDKITVLEIDGVDYFDVNVLILINQLGIKIPKKHNIPIYDNFAGICLIFFTEGQLWILERKKVRLLWIWRGLEERSWLIVWCCTLAEIFSLTVYDLDDLLPLNSFLSLFKILSKSFLSFMMFNTNCKSF